MATGEDSIIASLQVQVVEAVDQIAEWLSGLPANPFRESRVNLTVDNGLVTDVAIG